MKAQTQAMGKSYKSDLFAALSIDSLTLLLPHHEVHTLEPVTDLKTTQKQDKVAGWCVSGNTKVPIYCLSDEFEISDAIPNVRRMAVLINFYNGTIGLLCDDLNIISRKLLIEHPLPSPMRVKGTPLTGLATHENTVFCLSTANRLGKFLKEKSISPNTRTSE